MPLRYDRLIREYAATEATVTFINSWDVFCGPDGEGDPRFFADDGLHLSARGYEVWSQLVRAQLDKMELDPATYRFAG